MTDGSACPSISPLRHRFEEAAEEFSRLKVVVHPVRKLELRELYINYRAKG
jgi:hypothetical protein